MELQAASSCSWESSLTQVPGLRSDCQISNQFFGLLSSNILLSFFRSFSSMLRI